jgi:ubiquinone/menaquinone biosynthesis C-methylase UbiE
VPLTKDFPRLPFARDSIDTLFNLGTLATLDDSSLDAWLAELRRVGKNFWIALEASHGRDRSWWETRFLEAGFRKHPLNQIIVLFEAIESEGSAITLLFEKIPQAALDRHPLAELKKERDLHMDMLRETGIRSDAHIARYTLAREALKPGMVVLDVACGLGYGAATMAAATGTARIIGIDLSEWAVEYARANYGKSLPQLEFRAGDATKLGFLADASADAVVSFETLEHLPNPDRLLQEFNRVLKPGGLFIGSVPNLWIDEHGHNPVPYHLHIYDHDQFQEQIAKHFRWQALYRQNAGGGWKRPQPRTLALIEGTPTAADLQDAEWWISVACKPMQPSSVNNWETDGRGLNDRQNRTRNTNAQAPSRTAIASPPCHEY